MITTWVADSLPSRYPLPKGFTGSGENIGRAPDRRIRLFGLPVSLIPIKV